MPGSTCRAHERFAVEQSRRARFADRVGDRRHLVEAQRAAVGEDDIERRQTGMLGLAEETALQPMTAFVEREGERLWFFARSDTELARRIGQGGEGMFVFQQRDLQATITGQLSVKRDEARIAKYWNAVVAAWHPQGKSDPRLTLICLDARDAQVWCYYLGVPSNTSSVLTRPRSECLTGVPGA